MKQYPTVRKFFLCAFVLLSAIQVNSQTFFGVSSSPIDGNPSVGPTVTITPPASMQPGDLVIIFAQYRATSGTLSIATSGGQTWITEGAFTGSNQNTRIFWCRFNGTWSVNPQVTSGGGTTQALTAVMYVYRPTNSNSRWVMNAAQTNSSSGTNPNSINGITPSQSNSVTMAFWSSAATNTWTTLSGLGWLKTGLANQYRNTSTTGQTHTAAYKILTTAAATGNVAQTQSGTTTALKTIATWYEVNNNECGDAPLVSTSNTCINVAGTVEGATASTGVTSPSCGGNADDDVWYRVVPTTDNITITLSNLGSNLSSSGARIELFSGTCGSLTSIGCGTSPLTANSLTPGATYYIRIYSFGSTAITSLGNFRLCITEERPANVATGKSFINISRPGGGTIVPGDILEIRVSVNVSNMATNHIFRSRFNDTIPSNLTYVPGSLKLLTNEGKQYAAYTDGAGDDAAMYNGANKTIRFNLGRDTTNMPRGVVSNTGIDSSSGGYTNSNVHAPRGNGMLVIVTYRVTVDVSTPYNTIINYGPGALRYRNRLSSVAAIDYVNYPNNLSFIVYPNYGLCNNATGANNVSAGNGDFGSGTSHDAPNPGTVPGYTYLPITTGTPNDGSYSVVKNLSPSQSTNPFIPRPEDPNVDRVFRVWDIIGDHTGAADPLAGNPASPIGVNGGYMLAVNAAYQLSIANNQTITGLCENTYYEFSAWFRNVCKRCGSDSLGRGASGLIVNAAYIPTAPGDSSGVKPNLTFMIDGVDYYTSGDLDYIGEYGQWVKKGFVFMTGPGQTSLTISIKNNAPGGGGNDWVMDDIEFRTCLPALEMRPSINPTYCRNGQVDISVAVSTFFNNFSYYQWERSTDNGVTWTAAPESPSVQTFNYVNGGGTYRDTVALPSFLATPAVDGFRYRIRTSTSLSNIGVQNCAVYNNTDVVTVDVHPTCDVLPAQVTALNAELKNKYAVVKWKVKNELSLSAYTVERSDNAVQFKAIGVVFAKGTLTGEEQYLFNDPVPVTGKVYYRLKLISKEDVVKYSDMVSVTPGQQQNFMITNLVNPFESRLSFQLETYLNGFVDVQLADASGRLIMQRKVQVVKGVNAISLDVPANLQKGIYILRVKSEAGTINKTIQKQ